MKNGVYIYLLITLLVGFAVGYAIKSPANKMPLPTSIYENGSSNPDIRLKEKYKFTNPLLECAGTINSFVPINDLKKSLEDYINNRRSQGKVTDVAVYYRDLDNGPTLGINEYISFSPASLVKVPLMMVYFKLFEDDPGILTKKIAVTKNPDETYNQMDIVPKDKIKQGTEYTTEELITRMIVYSDNVAYDLLYDAIGVDKIMVIYKDLGVDISKSNTDAKDNYMTLKDYSAFFRILYNASYLDHNMSEKALQIMSKSTYMDGIVAGVPKGIVVAHKFGERAYDTIQEKQLHDCGVIYTPQKTIYFA